MKNNQLHLLTLGTVLLLIAFWVIASQLSSETTSTLIVENGVVETLTVACFLIGSFLVFGGPERSA